MIDIVIAGVTYSIPSSAADQNWAAKQVAAFQALAAQTETGVAVQMLSKNVTPVGTGADTTEDLLMSYPLPAGTLVDNGQGIRVTAFGTGVNTADATTLRAYFGATVLLAKVLTVSQNNKWKCVFEVLRTGASSQLAMCKTEDGGASANVVGRMDLTTPAEILSGIVTIKLTGQRAVSSVANSIQQYAMFVELLS